jgi:hypothetical protein
MNGVYRPASTGAVAQRVVAAPVFQGANTEGRVASLAAAMRAVGAGRATIDGLSLDLTEAPLAAPTAPRAPAPTLTDEQIKTRDEAILFGAGAGKRVNLR